MSVLEETTVESSELVEQTFNFWFKDQDHIRSPFPSYIRSELKSIAVKRFFEWTAKLNDKAKEEINDTIIGEKFEEIIFEIALGLVLTEDERITINYPFMPRLGDVITDQAENGKKTSSMVVDRAIVKDGDQLFLSVSLEKEPLKEKWKTRFELPA